MNISDTVASKITMNLAGSFRGDNHSQLRHVQMISESPYSWPKIAFHGNTYIILYILSG